MWKHIKQNNSSELKNQNKTQMNWVKKGLPSFWTDYLRSDTYWVAAPEPVTSWQPIAKEADACFRPHVSQMHMQPGKPMFQRLSCHVRIRSCQQKSFKEILFYLRNMLGLDLTLTTIILNLWVCCIHLGSKSC